MSNEKRLWLLLQCKNLQLDRVAVQCSWTKIASECSMSELYARTRWKELMLECDRLEQQLTAFDVMKELRS